MQWQKRGEFKEVVMRMGSFHVSCAFPALIGKRFGDAGLKDLLIEAGVVGPNTIAGVVSCKHYNRAIRASKVAYEALLR